MKGLEAVAGRVVMLVVIGGDMAPEAEKESSLGLVGGMVGSVATVMVNSGVVRC